MNDENERSVASAGSVAGKPVAWIAVFDGDDADGEFVWPDKGRAIEWASTRPGVRIAPLYLQPQSAVVASAGSVEPVAWAVVSDSTEQIDCEFVFPDEATAGDVALDSNGGVAPLYRHPQPTLTDEEREAVDTAEASLMRESTNRNTPEPVRQRFGAAVNTLRGLLERMGGGR